MTHAEIILAELYAPIAAELEDARVRFDEEIRSEHPFVNELCAQVKRYRGKMLRPALLLLTGRAIGKLVDDHVTLAAVVEMVHVATLVHDDVLDEADVRRRQATVNAMSGNEAAVMLGDYLISHAFHLCSALDSQYASREIGATTNTVCEGELSQIHHRGNPRLSESRYIDIIQGKTAALTGACCALGARFADAPAETVETMRQFGIELGTAFQIVDDMLDLVGSSEQVGKTLGRDLDLGKPTLPVIHSLANADPQSRACLETLIQGGTGADRQAVQEILQRTAGIDYARRVAREFVTAALERLAALPESPSKNSLVTMAEFILRRDH
ncbi:MAG: polyprenyl synthetase family protein [Phycisphaerae bacterium]|nr:polyprenyl synthetase family protein [Phycisphaerae bacterium]